MAKTLDEAGVKRLIQEIKGANKNLNAPIPISTENTPESIAQNVKNIADYVEKAKAAGIANVDGMAITCLIDDGYSGVGSIGSLPGNIEISICGIITYDGIPLENPTFFAIDPDGTYRENNVLIEHSKDIITSDMLVQGARKPIILTPSTTEVDEETYQKLLSDDVDVVFKTGYDNLCTLTYKSDDGDAWNFYFTCFSFEGDTIDVTYIYAYIVDITKNSPHTCHITENISTDLQSFINGSGYLTKSTLTPVLQEIDLTGTDADRKAKLDQFETDWKALTGASDLTGARFLGFVDVESGLEVIFSYNASNGYWSGLNKFADGVTSVTISPLDGSLTITPLFSHLEAITIKTNNATASKVANVAAIKAYVDNLIALGVDTTKGFLIPINAEGQGSGFISRLRDTDSYMGIMTSYGIPTFGIAISVAGEYYSYRYQTDSDNSLTTESKQIVGAINEINANAVHSDKLVPTLEAITIKTKNSTDDKAANVAAIKAYVDNLKLLGVDVTKGYMIPFNRYNSIAYGILVGSGENPRLQGYMNSDYTTEAIFISPDGTVNEISLQSRADAGLETNSKVIIKAINEVNALAKGKQDKLTSGTNIKTVNGQSLLGSGDITISGGGGSAPVLVDIDDITGSAGVSVPVDVFNKIANAASAKTPIFGYSKLVNGPRTTYEIIPLYVKNVSTTAGINGSLSIQFIAEHAYNSIGIMKSSDTECSISISSSSPFALDTSVDKSSTRGIQSSAVWNEIHSEPMTVNTATSGVTTLSSTDKHKILCYADSGTQQYNLPSSPVDGETFLFLKVKSGHAITIQSGTGNENIYDCSSGNSVVSKTIATSTKGKITVTYSSTVGKWFLMADDFLS